MITIILESPSHPGNVGAAARAMHTMGLNDLGLINPCEISQEALQRARGGADILKNATIYNQEIDCLSQFDIIYGASSRPRSLHLPVLSSKALSQTLKHEDPNHKIAILFGNEKNGLSNFMLNHCQAIIEIPALEEQSLNLSHAVQIICYELSQITLNVQKLEYASAKDRIDFMDWLQKYYHNKQFLLPHTLIRIQSIINKAKVTKSELNLLYSLLSSSNKDP